MKLPESYIARRGDQGRLARAYMIGPSVIASMRMTLSMTSVVGLAAAVLVSGTASAEAVVSAPVAAKPGSIRVVGHAGGGVYDVVLRYHKSGSARVVESVFAGKNTRNKAAVAARWVYTAPGARMRVGAGWRKPSARWSGDTWRGVNWGAIGHNGPKIPARSRLCTQFKGSSILACVKVK
ncbi:hypothetical protein [Streptomyces aureus]|uniref:hypothetical protein n=2 Tax=Streptomyces aureus TaxID=193461 RepID=UPI003644609C